MSDSSQPIVVSSNGTRVKVPHDLLLYFEMDPLPCPVVGCDWAGKKAGFHCCRKHGIPSAELRKLIGANATQGLCTVALSKERSELTRSQSPNVLINGEQRYDIKQCRRDQKGKQSRQAIQAAIKAREPEAVRRKLRAAGARSREPERREMARQVVKRTWAAMPKITKTCKKCGKQYETFSNRAAVSRFCGQKCRNAFNNQRRRREAQQDTPRLPVG